MNEYKLDHYYDNMCPQCYPGYGCKGDLCAIHTEEQRKQVKEDKPIADLIYPPQE
jgi:hypothetical protein